MKALSKDFRKGLKQFIKAICKLYQSFIKALL